MVSTWVPGGSVNESCTSLADSLRSFTFYPETMFPFSLIRVQWPMASAAPTRSHHCHQHVVGGQQPWLRLTPSLLLPPGVTIAINMWWEPSSLGSDGGRRQLHGYPFYYLRQSMCEALVTMMDQIVTELRPLGVPFIKPDTLQWPPDQDQSTELQTGVGSLGAEPQPLDQRVRADASPCTLEGDRQGGGEEAAVGPNFAAEAGRVDAAARLFVAIIASSQQSGGTQNCSGLIRPAEGPVGSRSSEVVPEEASGSRQGALPSDPAAAASKRMMMMMGDGDLLARLISTLSCRELAAMLYQVACVSMSFNQEPGTKAGARYSFVWLLYTRWPV